jgi:SAM-dependent methyltransferase
VNTCEPVAPTLTGERTAPDVWHENYWFRRHEAAYLEVGGWVAKEPALVVDAGCGEGYAATILRDGWPAARVLGLDYDPATTAHAARTYGDATTAYLRAGLTALPLASQVADVTLSLQVLEHIWTPGAYVSELARATAPGGTLVLSTPNRLTFSPGLGRRERPVNAYHCREYDAEELAGELAHWLPGWSVTLHGLGHGPRLRAWEAEHADLPSSQQLTDPDRWSPALAQLVRSVRCEDFELGAPDAGCLDLVAVAQSSPVERRDALS